MIASVNAAYGPALWKIARTILIAYLLVLGLAYLFQRRLIYFPSMGSDLVPAIPPAPLYAGLYDFTLSASDVVPLKAWHWPGERPLTLVVFHGNAGHRGHRLGWLWALRSTRAGVFILDYRGYGGSGGSPSEEGFYRDGEAAVDWLQSSGAGPLAYVGESLGTAVAVELALRRPPAALILQSPFTSAVDLGQRTYPFLPVRLLMRDRYPLLSKIDRVSCPVMVIHGQEDSIVPPAMGRAVFERAPDRKEWFPIPRADHNDPLWEIAPDYGARVGRFLGLP